MLPENFIHLSALPLSKNGKTDKATLRNTTYVPIEIRTVLSIPVTDIEKQILHVWKRILAREQIDVHDNFFDLGGNSLKVLKVIEEVNRELGTDLPVVKMFQFPTISTLAKFITAGNTDQGQIATDDARVGAVNVMEETLNLINDDRE